MEKSVVKALKLLEVLSAAEQPEGVTSLAKTLQVNKSNVHRLLQTLCDHGYVRRTDSAGNYELTLKTWQLGVAVLGRREIRRIAEPHLKALMNKTGESANLSVLEDGKVVYLTRIECRHPVRAHNPIGASLPVHCSSTGKAILAFQPEAVIKHYARELDGYTDKTITGKQMLLDELNTVRTRGYAVNRGEFREGVHGIAVPVRTADGSVAAAVGVSGPSERFKPRSIKRFAAEVKQCAEQISSELGYR